MDLADVLDAANGNLLVLGPFDTKKDAFNSLYPAFSTTEKDLWGGPGGGSAVVVGRGETFVAWFAVSRTEADLSCLGSDEITLADHSFSILVADNGDRYLPVAGMTCPPAESSLVGVTGARTALPATVGKLVRDVRAVSPVPVAVGFGVSRPAHVRAIAKAGADGVIVASALVDALGPDGRDVAALALLVSDLLRATTR